MEWISRMETGKAIRKRMVEHGLTVRQIQDALGLESPQAVYKWLNGQTLPSLENMAVLGRLFMCPMESLLMGEDGECALNRLVYADLSHHCLVMQEFIGTGEERAMGLLQRMGACCSPEAGQSSSSS